MTYYTESHPYLLAPSCDEGVYLRWLSPLANEEGWLFQEEVDEKPAVGEVTATESVDGRREVAIRRPGNQTRTLRAGNLTTAQFDALSTILDSPAVWQQNANGDKVPVYVVPGSLTRTTANSRHTASIDVRLPRRNALTN